MELVPVPSGLQAQEPPESNTIDFDEEDNIFVLYLITSFSVL